VLLGEHDCVSVDSSFQEAINGLSGLPSSGDTLIERFIGSDGDV
jgi:hypothetical protein